MKSILIFTTLVVLATANLDFEKFKVQYGKTYASPEEESYRLSIFEKNLKEIEEHNLKYEQGLVTFKKAINKYADWSKAEFRNTLPAFKSHQVQKRRVLRSRGNTPESIDWRDEGAVGPVPSQSVCGGWSPVAVGSMQSVNKIVNGELVLLSVSNLEDCVDGPGCTGGSIVSAYDYVKKNGINAASDYPQRYGTCQFQPDKIALKIRDYGVVNGTEDDLIEAIATIGPISVGVDVSDHFMFYTSGIFSDDTCVDNYINHYLLAVGYTKDAVILQNTWGSSWGENGYIRMKRGTSMCGLTTAGIYPIL